MESLNPASLVNIVGFSVGVVLYAMLGFMVLRSPHSLENVGIRRLLFATAFLGVLWNAGEFILTLQRDVGASGGNLFLIAASYSALGFLPSVVVHSALYDVPGRRWHIVAAYLLSTAASLLHFISAIRFSASPSEPALRLLTFGSIILAVLVVASGHRETRGKKLLWGAALLIFAASALHLSSPGSENSLVIEMAAHQSSLPLVLVILLQSYRFAFADLFLKRAISLLLVSLISFAAYTLIAVPLLRFHEGHDPADMQATAVIISLWIATALSFPALSRAAHWIVDRIILSRPNYEAVKAKIATGIDEAESPEDVLDTVCKTFADVFTAGERGWNETSAKPSGSGLTLVDIDRDRAEVFVPTHDEPFYKISIGQFSGGRRLLSDEMELLDSSALLAARRIDAMRVTHERCEQDLREQEFSKLATEAQLTALRAQINPHFLFNALTTIGYLIQTSPDKALQTLLHLTKLLRRVLGSGSEFSTLGEELELIQNYLDIERARFEEKLSVSIDVSESARRVMVPTLILQPLVENAVKHGIAKNRVGGTIGIKAEIEKNGRGDVLSISVRDTGSGRKETFSSGNGVGLSNVKERLRALYSHHAEMVVEIDGINGSFSGLRIPLEVVTSK